MKKIAIAGAGLVGSLLAIYLRKRKYEVCVFERRGDMRAKGYVGGRSINLALSNRGIKALEEVGLAETLKQIAIPMHGRMMHSQQSELSYQAYGKDGQYINSISRGALNLALINEAEKAGAKFYFDHKIEHTDLEKTSITFTVDEKQKQESFNLIIGADGAFSAIREAFRISDRFNYQQFYIEHGYKELSIPAGSHGEFLMEKNALHIWPRESYMLIALPNPDATFTCTLFFPFEGTVSFQSLQTDQQIVDFFSTVFPDAQAMMPHLLDEYKRNPVSSLVTVKCFPWVNNKTILIGDAAHAIVPFYGQGMNAGFEDCRRLNELLDKHADNWDLVLPEYQHLRKPDGDAIAQLALDNFIEMRDLVADADFLLRKKIEAHLHSLYPSDWIPLYSMVTFYEQIRYSEAYRNGQIQKSIMDEVMKTPEIESQWKFLNFEVIVEKYRILRQKEGYKNNF
ncbi:MAG: NAD(P)/FAD-dependent oxidoreductase [Cyclobacteriaceae bacterium]|jgi:kynurenine 3-monooxygenase|nr:NAD(P)/FAD-dependent oxidoreductase [Cyclobacteriaceae bacterium]